MQDYTTTAGSKVSTVITASQAVSDALVAGKTYAFTANTNCWIKQGTGAQTAAATTANNVLVPSGQIVRIHGSNGDNLSVARDTADGSCSLSLITQV